MTPFMTEDFLLDTEFARRLYHDYAKDQPIFDYHCHLPPQQIAEDYRFKNLYDIWLKGDHYKWRAMRTNGVAERLCTGDASDREKFDAWAATVPHTIGNPLYHWTHLELRRPFGITGKLLSPSTAARYIGGYIAVRIGARADTKAGRNATRARHTPCRRPQENRPLYSNA